MTRAQQLSELEARCRLAHFNGECWIDVFPSIDGKLRELEPFSQAKWRKLYDRLMHLTVSGDSSGQYPPPMTAPWELETESQGRLFDTSGRAGIDQES